MYQRSPRLRGYFLGLLFAFGTPSVAIMPAAATAAEDKAMTQVIIRTDKGDIELELDADRAPVTVENFLAYARDGFYDGTIFHRVIPGFMIQGGGFDAGMSQRETRAPIINESDNGLSNERGSIAMARTQDPHSATSQFFINVADNTQLDGRSSQPGYAVFGRVTEGMAVVDSIVSVPTTTRPPHRDVPEEPIHILGVEIADEM